MENKKCIHCKVDMDKKALICPKCEGKNPPIISLSKLQSVQVIFVVIAFIFTITTIVNSYKLDNNTSNSNISTANTNSSAPTPTAENQLKLLSFTCTHEYGFFEITGQVKNISNESLKNVEAEASTYTSDGQFVNSESSLIEYNPILSGQTSPFKVMMTYNPAMSKCDVNFKSLMGGAINTEVVSKK